MYSVPVVVVVMNRSPSKRIAVSYLTETCTTSDTSLPTWYRTTKLTCRAEAPQASFSRNDAEPTRTCPVKCSGLFGGDPTSGTSYCQLGRRQLARTQDICREPEGGS